MTTLVDTLSLAGANGGAVIGDTFFTFNDLAKMKTLHAVTNSAGSLFYATPREIGVSSGYQVPSGKKFIVVAVQIYSNGGALTDNLGLQTADTDVGMRSAAQPTGYDDSAAAATQWDLGMGVVSTSEAAVVNRARTVFRVVPAGKYLYFSFTGSGGSFIRIYGFEIDSDATEI